ncbi:MAG: NAD(P)H-dependent oxidoreductase, partial [Bifidobacterium mongoliense]|nr:NAD(P)H-dependent oxidoreductase [Bifidobacterium mongoliense]
LFKSFWDVTDTDVVLDMPVALTATGGSERHALMPDTDMRSLFAFLRAVPVPTSLVAAGKDWDSEGLIAHEERAGEELGALILLGARRAMLEAAGAGYRHGVGMAHAYGD